MQSISSKLIEKALWKLKLPNLKESKTFENIYNKALKEPHKDFRLPRVKLNSRIDKMPGDLPVYKLDQSSNKCILYLHGGGFLYQLQSIHLKFLDGISIGANVDVYIPIYPLAPKYTCEDTYPFLVDLYNNLLIKYGKDNIILMGDSAGGGMCLALNDLVEEKAGKIIVISPWLCGLLTEEYLAYESIDPLLSVYGLNKMIRAWAGHRDPLDPMISPIHGSLDISSLMIVSGHKDLLHLDSLKLYEKLKDTKCQIKYLDHPNMLHTFPLFPIPEAKIVGQKIVDYILET